MRFRCPVDPSADQLAAYARLAPATRDSGKRVGNYRWIRGGNKDLKRTSEGVSSIRRIEQPRPAHHLRPRGERVELWAAFAEDVLHRKAPNHQSVGDHPPVAAPPHRLRTHETHPLLTLAEPDQPLEVGPELGSCHVVGIAAEGGVVPASVRRIRARESATPQARQVRVAYRTLATQPLGERLPVEVRVTRGVGEAAHVDQAANSVRSEKAQELLEGPRRMPDGEDEVRAGFGIRPASA